MTTICCNREEMAADSWAVNGGTRHTITKIHRIGDSIVGFAGTLSNCQAALSILKKFAREASLVEILEEDCKSLSDVGFLVLTPQGIWEYEGGAPFRIKDRYAAIGTGDQGAMALMHAGYSPGEAVKIMRQVDPSTGGRVRVLRLKR